MFDGMTPGQTITCEIIKQPLRQDDQQTLARLMRQDSDIQRKLRHAQERRRKHTPTKTRGGREWVQRVSPAQYAVPNLGATWSMPYLPILEKDFASVAEFLKVSAE